MSETPSPGWHGEPPAAVEACPQPALPAVPVPPARHGWRRNFLGVLGAGLALAVLRRPRLEALRLDAALFWALLLCQLPLAALLDWYAVEPPRQFSRWGIETLVAYNLLTVLVAFVLARFARRAELLWPVAVLLSATGLYSDSVGSLLQHQLLPALGGHHPRLSWLVYGGCIAWLWLIVARILGALQAMRAGRALLASGAAVAGIIGASFLMPQQLLWNHDYAADEAQRDRGPPPLIAEEVFARQDQLLDQALAGIAPNRSGKPGLYFVAYAPDGEQDVFMKEARYGTRLFQTRFGAARRSLALVNNRRTVDELPLATAANLERALGAIARKMDPQQDILFLYLTSHGSRDAELAVQLEDFSFSAFTAARLAQILKDSGIRWKVIVVSACYSGSFLNSLKDDHTLVLTAARADRTSFGCSDDADFTYFGRAYLERALNHTTSFTEAFAEARGLVDGWETRQHYTHSEPQMAKGALIGDKLEQWRATLPADTLASTAAPVIPFK
ncbi:MAG: hypothetical protein JOY51_08080 [Nevskia sp.]|nr:hypothetical protein [Nevskia sp.]